MPDARLDNSTLHLSRIFEAPRERVFDAWVNRDQFVRWMCPPMPRVPSGTVDGVTDSPPAPVLNHAVCGGCIVIHCGGNTGPCRCEKCPSTWLTK